MEKPSVHTLIEIAAAYRAAADVPLETTVSYRVFGDTKKLAQLRGSADITLSRFNAAMTWFAENWPEGHSLPKELAPWVAAPAPAPVSPMDVS